MGRRLGKYLVSTTRESHEPRGVEVRTGRNVETNQSVIVKAFDTGGFVQAAGCRELVMFEVETMSRTNSHPNIVELHDVMASPSKLFVILEEVPGSCDLFQKIADRGR